MNPGFSILSLLAFNLLTIYLAVTNHWNLPHVLWVYWFQSVAIGLVTVVRILRLTNFSTERYKVNGVRPEPTVSTQRQAAFHFFLIYGFFHLAYLMVIFAFEERGEFATADATSVNMGYVYLAAAAFFLNHVIAYVKTESETRDGQNIGTIFSYPFLRILPMHLMPFFATKFISALPFFLVLKTLADVGMELVEQRIYRRARRV